LQGRKAVAMQSCVGISGIQIETLSKDQTGLAMRVASGANKSDVGGERYVAGHFLPNKMKRVVGEPHVRASARDGVTALGRVELRGTGSSRSTHVPAAFEYSDGCAARVRGGHIQSRA